MGDGVHSRISSCWHLRDQVTEMALTYSCLKTTTDPYQGWSTFLSPAKVRVSVVSSISYYYTARKGILTLGTLTCEHRLLASSHAATVRRELVVMTYR
jgi:hypothetical protein